MISNPSMIPNSSYRPYRLLQPFENANIINISNGTSLLELPNSPLS